MRKRTCAVIGGQSLGDEWAIPPVGQQEQVVAGRTPPHGAFAIEPLLPRNIAHIGAQKRLCCVLIWAILQYVLSGKVFVSGLFLPCMTASALGAHGFSLRQTMTQPILYHQYHNLKIGLLIFYAGQKTARSQRLRPRLWAFLVKCVCRCFPCMTASALGAHGFSLRKIMKNTAFRKSET